MSDGDADSAAPFALDAHAVRRDARAAVLDGGCEDLEELAGVDRAAVQLEVDSDVRGDRRRARERLYVFGVGIDDRAVFGDVGEVAQRLDAATRRAGTDRDQPAGHAAYLVDPLGIGVGGYRALDERDIVGALDDRAGGLWEVGDLHFPRQWDELVLAVEQGELAAVAGRELPDGQLRAALVCHVTPPGIRAGPRPGRKAGPGRRRR